jgi:hypothetical protein
VILALASLAEAAVRRGDLGAMRSLHDESLRVARALGDPDLLAVSLSGQALVAELAGEYAAARRYCEEGLTLRPAGVENGRTIAARVRLARVWLQEGETARAEPLLAESLVLLRRLDLPAELDQILHHLATVALAHDDPARAAWLLGAAEAEQERTGMYAPSFALDGIARNTTKARAALGHDIFVAAYDEGRALSRDAAIALALAQTTGAGTPRGV